MKRNRTSIGTSSIAMAALLALAFALVGLRAVAQSASSVGQWTSVMSWPLEAIHSNVLPNGTVMTWGDYNTSTIPSIWNPVTNAFSTAAAAPYPLFCAGHVLLGNGQLIVLGGLIEGTSQGGSADANIYDYTTNTWTWLPEMNAGRYYPTATTLPNGDVLIIAGLANPNNNTLPQIWDVPSSSWINLTTAQMSLPTYPKMFVAPNGNVFLAGPMPQTNYLNTSGTGSWTTVATTKDTSPRDYGPAVMYDGTAGKILIVGGGNPPTATAETINLGSANPAWTYTSSMTYARRQANATILADGTVLVTGGTDGTNPAIFDDYTNPVYPAELWNPATGTWTVMASVTRYRGYHSTAVLLPDGRVLSAGGDKSCANQGPALCLQPSAEIYSPPYLFQGPQPTITSAPASVTYGQTFFVQTPDAENITQVTWIRLSTVTHTFNESQRINFLSFGQDANSQGLDITAPANGNLAPPGYYMLFILSSGVPSVAAIVQIQGQNSSNPTFAISATPTSQTVAQGSGTTYTATVTGSNGFSDGVTLSASGLPSGAGATFSPLSVTGSGTSTMSVTTSATTPPGTYNVTVTGTDAGTQGASVQNTSVTLVVTSSAGASFTVSALPASLTLKRGSNGKYTVTVTPSNGFTGKVTLSVSGLPANTLSQFVPTSITGSGNATLAIGPGTAAPTGTFTVTITGTSGSQVNSTTVSLTLD
jgi:hypothetical protein